MLSMSVFGLYKPQSYAVAGLLTQDFIFCNISRYCKRMNEMMSLIKLPNRNSNTQPIIAIRKMIIVQTLLGLSTQFKRAVFLPKQSYTLPYQPKSEEDHAPIKGDGPPIKVELGVTTSDGKRHDPDQLPLPFEGKRQK